VKLRVFGTAAVPYAIKYTQHLPAELLI